MGSRDRSAIQVLKGHEGAMRAVAWSPDDSQISSGGADKTLRFRDTNTGRLNAVMPMNAAISALAWLPDGKSVAVADDQKTIQFVDAESKTSLRTLTHDEVVSDMAITADGQQIVAADTAGTVYLWEVATGTRLLADAKMRVAGETTAERHPAWVAFSHDGKHLAAGGACRTVRVGEISSRLQAFELSGHADMIRALAWSPDGKTIVTCCGSADAALRYWNIGDGKANAVVEGYRPTWIGPIAWSSDGSTLAFRRGDGSDWFLDIKLDKPVVRVFEQSSIFGWSTGGECVLRGALPDDLATRYYSGNITEVRVISLESGKVLNVLKTGNVGRMSLSRDGKTLVTNPYDANEPRLLVWDTESGQLRQTITGADLNLGDLCSIAINADGSKFALVFPYGVLVVDVATRQILKWLDHKGNSPGNAEGLIGSLPDNKRFFAAAYAPSSTNAGTWIFDPEAGTKIDLSPPEFTGVSSTPNGIVVDFGPVAISPNSRFATRSIGINALPIWETASGRVQATLLTYQCKDRPIHFTMDSSGNYAWLTEDTDEMVFVVGTDQGQETLTPDEFSRRYGWKNDPTKMRLVPESVSAPAKVEASTPPSDVSPSETAAAPASKNAVKIEPEPIDIQPGQPLSGLALTVAPAAIERAKSWTIETAGHRGGVRSVAYSPNGRFLATASDDGVVRLWDAVTNSFVRALIGHEAGVRALAWSPDSQFLASGSADKTIVLWDVAQGRRLRVLRGHVEMSIRWAGRRTAECWPLAAKTRRSASGKSNEETACGCCADTRDQCGRWRGHRTARCCSRVAETLRTSCGIPVLRNNHGNSRMHREAATRSHGHPTARPSPQRAPGILPTPGFSCGTPSVATS
jgi:WD40 repeat protein